MAKSFLIGLITMLCSGCAVYHIPLPTGEATIRTFLMTADIPKFTATTSNCTMTLEGYTTKGDAAMVTASGDALGVMVGAAIRAGVAAGAIP
jgi:hypothetical protein